jgi:GAF domain-containing protein
MNFLRSLLPNNTPPALANKSDILILRERILQYLLLISQTLILIAGFVAIATSTPSRYVSSGTIFFAAFGFLFLLFILRTRLPFNFRAATLLTILYLGGVSALINNGLEGNGRILLLGFTVLTAVLVGVRSGVGSLLLSLLSMGGIGYGMTNHLIDVPPISVQLGSSNIGEWLSAGSLFLFLTVITTISISILLVNIQQSLNKQKDLTGELEKERSALAIRIQERTRNLERRLNQIRTVNEVSRTISSVLDQNILIQQVVELVKERFNLYYAGVFLVDDIGRNAVLRAGTGEAGQKMLSLHHSLAIGGSSMIGWCIQNKKARIALDVGKDAVRFNNPHLPLTHSELALPIISRNNAIGALTIQSNESNAFDEDDILILQGIADSLAIALQNATLFEQNRRDLDEIRALNREYLQKSWSMVLDNVNELGYTYETHRSVLPNKPLTTIELPVQLRDETIGKLSIEAEQEELTQEEKAFVDSVIQQTALALENARLLETTQRHAIEEEKINDLSLRLSSSISIDQILETATALLKELPMAYDVSIRLLEPGEPPTGIEEQPVILPIAHNGQNKPATDIILPIKLRYQILGTVYVRFEAPSISEEMVNLLRNATNRLSLALDNARLLEELEGRVEREHMISEINSQIRASTDIESILKTAALQIGSTLGIPEVLVQLNSMQDESINR